MYMFSTYQFYNLSSNYMQRRVTLGLLASPITASLAVPVMLVGPTFVDPSQNIKYESTSPIEGQLKQHFR